jgi:hypothetical protein
MKLSALSFKLTWLLLKDQSLEEMSRQSHSINREPISDDRDSTHALQSRPNSEEFMGDACDCGWYN